MRKHKFRAWDKWNEEMIYQHDMNYPLENKEYLFTLNEEYVELLRYDEDYSAYAKYDVDIMQYTDVNDLNNNEIYEGDIVKVEDYFGKNLIGKVIYDVSSACYYIMEGTERNHFMMTFDYLEDYVHEVIGNIYENKDILGE